MDAESKDWKIKCDFVVRVNKKSDSEFPIDGGEVEPNSQKRPKDQLCNSPDLKNSRSDSTKKWPENEMQDRSLPCVGYVISAVTALLHRTKASTESLEPRTSQPVSYFFRASSVIERNLWVNQINQAVGEFRREKDRQQREQEHFLSRNQLWLRGIYMSIQFRMVTAIIVGLNFLSLVRRASSAPYLCPSPVPSPGARFCFVYCCPGHVCPCRLVRMYALIFCGCCSTSCVRHFLDRMLRSAVVSAVAHCALYKIPPLLTSQSNIHLIF